MALESIKYSSLSIQALIAVHNELAKPRGEPEIRRWGKSRCELVQRVAILRTRKILPPPEKRPAARVVVKKVKPLRDAILKALGEIAYYEDRDRNRFSVRRITNDLRRKKRAGKEGLFSVGFSYNVIFDKLRKKFPDRVVTPVFIRVCAARARLRTDGYTKCRLPDKRPHGLSR